MRVPLWFDEGYAGLGRRRVGAARRCWSSISPWSRGAVPDAHRRSTARSAGSASTADAAYALAASAVTELARRNPTGTLTPLLDRLGAGEDFEAAVLATTGLDPRPVRGGLAARRPAAVQPGAPGSSRAAAGCCGSRCPRIWCAAGAGPIGHAGPRSTKAGRWSRKPRTGLNLTRPRNGGSLIALCPVPPSVARRGGPPPRRSCWPDAISSSWRLAVVVLVAGYLTLARGASQRGGGDSGHRLLRALSARHRPLGRCWSSRHGPCA